MSLQVGRKTIKFSSEKIKKIIRDHHDAIKGLLIAQVSKTLKNNTANAAVKVLEQYKLDKEHWINTDPLMGKFKIGSFGRSKGGDNIEIRLSSDICTLAKHTEFKNECLMNKVTQPSISRLNPWLHHASITNSDANLVVSVSEDYLNKLLVATYDAGMWNESLEEVGIKLGPNKLILKLDKPGPSGTLILDVLYQPTNLEKLITGTTQIRFPLMIEVSINIEKKNGNPVLVVSSNLVDHTDKILRFGYPEQNIISNIETLRFKEIIINRIRVRTAVLENSELFELIWPELAGIGLHNVDFVSDGKGRMNAIMSLEDLNED